MEGGTEAGVVANVADEAPLAATIDAAHLGTHLCVRGAEPGGNVPKRRLPHPRVEAVSAEYERGFEDRVARPLQRLRLNHDRTVSRSRGAERDPGGKRVAFGRHEGERVVVGVEH